MAPADRPKRWSIDLAEQATPLEELGAAALVFAALFLAGIGLARLAGAHPSGLVFVTALALAGAGVLILSASLGSSLARNARRTVWAARADASRAGVLLFLLEPVAPRPDAETAVRRLGPLRCLARPLPAGAGAAAGAGGGGDGAGWAAELARDRAGREPAPTSAGETRTWEAPDQRISRVGGVLTTRWHAGFFAGAPDARAGGYEVTWEERTPDGGWRVLASLRADVPYQPLAEEPPAEPSPA